MHLNLLLGHSRSGVPQYWHDPPNPHAYLSGRSGMGKSHLLKKLVLQAAEQEAHVIILDYSGDFTGFAPPTGIPCAVLDVSAPAFVINPLAPVPGRSREAVLQQLLSSLQAVFRLGPRAILAVRSAATQYLATEPAHPSLEGLIDFIENEVPLTSGLCSALEPLQLLGSVLHPGDMPLSLDLSRPGLTVIRFDQISDYKMRAVLIELILQSLWNLRTAAQADCSTPMILCLDECQNLAWHEGCMATRLLREGRKFNLAGWFSSQWMTHPLAREHLGQAALQVHFRPAAEHVSSLAKVLSNEKAEIPLLKPLIQHLQRGQFLLKRSDGKHVVVYVEA